MFASSYLLVMNENDCQLKFMLLLLCKGDASVRIYRVMPNLDSNQVATYTHDGPVLCVDWDSLGRLFPSLLAATAPISYYE